MKKLSVLLFCCLLLAACGNGKTDGSNAAEAHQSHKPSLDAKVEVNGHDVKVTVTTDMTISKNHYGQARQDGEGHIHMYLDGGEKMGVKAPEHVIPNVPTGHHSLKVSLHNNDHTPYDVTKTYEFEVK
ncbi:hypothetical protein E5161_09310 [Cohnella pontilimi]|uniref:DUF4399 domain-containing protein n=1 Tax=Cohnella pontilimi TaxID=2564100 RepID=A0A4U0FBV0_9BACL|nr:hypothetical protein [Cohnella pontilimi]TJY42197.1 hypothetical protein E5161_09310 [Cohnella pontilimi]